MQTTQKECEAWRSWYEAVQPGRFLQDVFELRLLADRDTLKAELASARELIYTTPTAARSGVDLMTLDGGSKSTHASR